MTVHALTKADGSTGPGLAGTFPVTAGGGRAYKIDVYDWNQGTDVYTVGGEDISAIWNDFTEVHAIIPVQKETSTEADNRTLTIDLTNKKLLIYTGINTESTAADQGVVAARLVVFGYA